MNAKLQHWLESPGAIDADGRQSPTQKALHILMYALHKEQRRVAVADGIGGASLTHEFAGRRIQIEQAIDADGAMEWLVFCDGSLVWRSEGASA